MSSYIADLVDIRDYNYDDDFEYLELLRGILRELKTDPKLVALTIEKKIDILEYELAERNICPECGRDLEWERDSSEDTWVPYGSTMTSLEDGGRMRCPHCGYERE